MEEKDDDRKIEDAEARPAVPQEVPEQTYWPVMAAAGVLFFFFGLLTTLIVTGIGIVFMAISFAGWIQN
ncbi:MAG TPA: hypothetical protein VMC08_09275, partial [Bacteroidales bacterium]|nr:hypothetical protein [Bacteroidales bacterium]